MFDDIKFYGNFGKNKSHYIFKDMRKSIFAVAALAAVFFASCKEQLVSMNTGLKGSDTTYITAAETPQGKNILVEEMSGVTCVNCPDGIDQLNGYNASETYKDKLIIVGIHTGGYTTPIKKEGHESKYDFRTDEGAQIVGVLLGGDPPKPAAGFDRLPLGAGTPPVNILDNKSKWASMLSTAFETKTTPVNISIVPKYIAEESAYDILVKVSYTEPVSEKLNLNVYLTENGIVDVQQFPSEYKNDYVHNHVFRTCLTSFNGQEILPALDTKEAGRVFEQHFILKIDPTNAKQKDWKPENMEVVAFVNKAGGVSDQRVLQTVVAHLE